MKISNNALRELKVLLEKDYPHTEFTDAELLEIALNLLQNVKLVYTGEHLDKYMPKEK